MIFRKLVATNRPAALDYAYAAKEFSRSRLVDFASRAVARRLYYIGHPADSPERKLDARRIITNGLLGSGRDLDLISVKFPDLVGMRTPDLRRALSGKEKSDRASPNAVRDYLADRLVQSGDWGWVEDPGGILPLRWASHAFGPPEIAYSLSSNYSYFGHFGLITTGIYTLLRLAAWGYGNGHLEPTFIHMGMPLLTGSLVSLSTASILLARKWKKIGNILDNPIHPGSQQTMR